MFFRRSSTQNFEGQDELNDPIFKPIDCKQHISFGSLAGADFKLDPNILNMNLPKLNKEDEYPNQQQHPSHLEPPNDNLNSNTFSKNNNSLNNALANNSFTPSFNNINVPSNTLSNNTLNNPISNNSINTPLNNNNLIQNNAPSKKNFLFAFQDLKSNKQ